MADRQKCEGERKRDMRARQGCAHEGARFYAAKRQGQTLPFGLWHCPACKATVAVEATSRTSKPLAAA